MLDWRSVSGTHWTDWLRVCSRCGDARPPISVFCRVCSSQLSGIMNGPGGARQNGYPFDVYSLFTWTFGNDSLVRPLLYSFKGGRLKTAARAFADELSFVRSAALNGSARLRPIFVVPPSGNGFEDHAAALARALGGSWRAPVFTGLARFTSAKQKSRPGHERRDIVFFCRQAPPRTAPDETLVFVDDVITTGSTAFAAFEALQRPAAFEVWTLAARPRHFVGKGDSPRFFCPGTSPATGPKRI